ncbi:MAG TPA: hypothetical protein VNQ90_03385 [Chthoniobacteraceae bacterium]|nr:hypothetical protein [Chthoniobacteraceae bacterium]
MKPSLQWLILIFSAGLAACALHPRTSPDPLVGTWVFDKAATKTEIQKTTGYPDEWMDHIMKAYSPAVFTFSNGRYTMSLPGKKVTGRYSLAKQTANSYRMTMTCSDHPEGDAGLLIMREQSFSFQSDTPLVTGAREIYRKKAE